MASVSVRPGDVLLVIDVINDLEFDGGDKVAPWADKAAVRLKEVLETARHAQVPIIYANDNFGRWRDDFSEIYRSVAGSLSRGRKVAKILRPRDTDYFILKPKHSAFYCTSLNPLLKQLKAKRLLLAGIATNLCVMFTAHDAHMEGYRLVVLSDCCASESDFDHDIALQQLKTFCRATICRADELTFRSKRGRPAGRNAKA